VSRRDDLNRHAVLASLPHHICGAASSGERDHKIRLPINKHLSVADWSSRAPVGLPIGGVCFDAQAFNFGGCSCRIINPAGCTMNDDITA
jgi:hypothetical protein